MTFDEKTVAEMWEQVQTELQAENEDTKAYVDQLLAESYEWFCSYLENVKQVYPMKGSPDNSIHVYNYTRSVSNMAKDALLIRLYDESPNVHRSEYRRHPRNV